MCMAATMPQWAQDAARAYGIRIAVDAKTIPGKMTDPSAVDVVELQRAFEAGVSAAIKVLLTGNSDNSHRCVNHGESSGPDN